MAHIMGLDEEEAMNVKPALSACLRVYDDATILPQGHRSIESNAFKNVVMRVDGHEPNLMADAFSPNWFSGVSVLCVPNEIAEPLLRDSRKNTPADMAKLCRKQELYEVLKWAALVPFAFAVAAVVVGARSSAAPLMPV